MNSCRNDRTYLAIGKSSLRHLLLSKFHDTACEALLMRAFNFQLSRADPYQLLRSPVPQPDYTDQPIQLRFCKQTTSTVFTGIPTSVESCNRIPCVVLHRLTIPLSLFFIWFSLARATENYLWIQQLQYNYNAQWISIKGTWKD